MKISLIISMTAIMTGIAENSNLRTSKPLRLFQGYLSRRSGPYGGYLR